MYGIVRRSLLLTVGVMDHPLSRTFLQRRWRLVATRLVVSLGPASSCTTVGGRGCMQIALFQTKQFLLKEASDAIQLLPFSTKHPFTPIQNTKIIMIPNETHENGQDKVVSKFRKRTVARRRLFPGHASSPSTRSLPPPSPAARALLLVSLLHITYHSIHNHQYSWYETNIYIYTKIVFYMVITHENLSI